MRLVFLRWGWCWEECLVRSMLPSPTPKREEEENDRRRPLALQEPGLDFKDDMDSAPPEETAGAAPVSTPWPPPQATPQPRRTGPWWPWQLVVRTARWRRHSVENQTLRHQVHARSASSQTTFLAIRSRDNFSFKREQ